MNRRIKKDLQQAFMAPATTKKELFFKNFNYPKTTRWQFILNQAGYIRIRTWIISLVLMGFVICIVNSIIHESTIGNVNIKIITVSSALMPPLVLNAITELVRSKQHGMEELEMTTRYSFTSILLVRMGVLGINNLIVFMGIALMLVQKTGLGILRISTYLLIPYLATILVSLWIINHRTGRDMIYPCAAASILVSSMIWLLGSIYDEWYMERNLCWGIIMLFLLILLSMKELRKSIMMSELV